MKVFLIACLIAVAFCKSAFEVIRHDVPEAQVRDFTINHKLRRIQEVVAKEGTPGASSPPVNSAHTVDKAFNQPPSFGNGFLSKTSYGDAPQMIWYHFRKAFKPAEITFRSMGTNYITPTKYQFVGTNDDHCNQYSIWDIICEDLRGLKITTRYQTQRCVVSDFHTKSYKCLGIRVLGTFDNTPNFGIANIRYFKKV